MRLLFSVCVRVCVCMRKDAGGQPVDWMVPHFAHCRKGHMNISISFCRIRRWHTSPSSVCCNSKQLAWRQGNGGHSPEFLQQPPSYSSVVLLHCRKAVIQSNRAVKGLSQPEEPKSSRTLQSCLVYTRCFPGTRYIRFSPSVINSLSLQVMPFPSFTSVLWSHAGYCALICLD